MIKIRIVSLVIAATAVAACSGGAPDTDETTSASDVAALSRPAAPPERCTPAGCPDVTSQGAAEDVAGGGCAFTKNGAETEALDSARRAAEEEALKDARRKLPTCGDGCKPLGEPACYAGKTSAEVARSSQGTADPDWMTACLIDHPKDQCERWVAQGASYFAFAKGKGAASCKQICVSKRTSCADATSTGESQGL